MARARGARRRAALLAGGALWALALAGGALLYGPDGWALPAGPARAAVVLRYDFDDGVEGWRTPFPGATLQAVREVPGREPATPGLEFNYTPNMMTSPSLFALPEAGAAGARSVRFWIRCSADAPLQFALAERDGSAYYSPLQCPKDEWVHVVLPLADLSLAPPSTDEDRRFNPAELAAVRFQDVSRYHALPGQLGARRLWLAEMEFVTEAVPSRHVPRAYDVGRGVTVDRFDGPAFAWEANTSVRTRLVPLRGGNMARLTYLQGGEGLPKSILTHLDGDRLLAGTQGIRIVLRSQREADLHVRLAEYLPDYRSVTYEYVLKVPEGRAWHSYYIPYSYFRLAQGVTDENQRFDPGKVWILQLTDSRTAAPPAENSLELAEIAAISGRGR